MGMAVPVESAWPAAETAIGHALTGHDRASVEAGRHFANESRTAVTTPDESHRCGANGPTPHHGQDDAARAFHVAALAADAMLDCSALI